MTRSFHISVLLASNSSISLAIEYRFVYHRPRSSVNLVRHFYSFSTLPVRMNRIFRFAITERRCVFTALPVHVSGTSLDKPVIRSPLTNVDCQMNFLKNPLLELGPNPRRLGDSFKFGSVTLLIGVTCAARRVRQSGCPARHVPDYDDQH